MKKIIGKYIGWSTDGMPMMYEGIDLWDRDPNSYEIIKTDLKAVGYRPAFTYKPSPEGAEDEYSIVKGYKQDGKAIYYGLTEARMNEYLFFDFTEHADIIEKHRIK